MSRARGGPTDQGDDGTLRSQLGRAEEHPDEAVDEFMLWVHHGVVIRNLFSLDIQGKSSLIDQRSAQGLHLRFDALTDKGCLFSSNMSRERFESLRAEHNAHKFNKHPQQRDAHCGAAPPFSPVLYVIINGQCNTETDGSRVLAPKRADEVFKCRGYVTI